jgi:predicted  nucleic acid-binding Zn-ribbon protein
MDLDRSALAEIWAAGVEDVVRCTECGAILIRS